MITLKSIFLGVVFAIVIFILLIYFLCWLDSKYYDERDEHTDTDNVRG